MVNYDKHFILIDNKSSTDILFYNTFARIDLTRDRLKRLDPPLVEFFENAIPMEEVISLPVIIGQMPRQSTI